MGLDLRIPVGTLFAVIGVLLAAYGGATLGEPGTAPTGVPINLVWGWCCSPSGRPCSPSRAGLDAPRGATRSLTPSTGRA